MKEKKIPMEILFGTVGSRLLFFCIFAGFAADVRRSYRGDCGNGPFGLE